MLLFFRNHGPTLPGIVLKAILEPGDEVPEGTVVDAVAIPWFEILELIRRDPESIYQIGARRWEEIIAGAYSLKHKVTSVVRLRVTLSWERWLWSIRKPSIAQMGPRV